MTIKKIASLSGLAALLVACVCDNGSMEGDAVSIGTESAPGTYGDFKANVTDRVYFDLNKYNVSAEAHKTLEGQAGWLKTYTNTAATLEGHCDERGTREYNLALGERRANAAKKALVKLGVEAHRLNTISYGKDRPVAEGHNEQAWALNRTAITVIDAATGEAPVAEAHVATESTPAA